MTARKHEQIHFSWIAPSTRWGHDIRSKGWSGDSRKSPFLREWHLGWDLKKASGWLRGQGRTIQGEGTARLKSRRCREQSWGTCRRPGEGRCEVRQAEQRGREHGEKTGLLPKGRGSQRRLLSVEMTPLDTCFQKVSLTAACEVNWRGPEWMLGDQAVLTVSREVMMAEWQMGGIQEVTGRGGTGEGGWERQGSTSFLLKYKIKNQGDTVPIYWIRLGEKTEEGSRRLGERGGGASRGDIQ